ncbi:MAG TPA: FecR family protein [bacterium]|nr:FecR family protein [bacterium]
MMNCRTAQNEMESLAASGSGAVSRDLAEHLRHCESCRKEQAILTGTLNLLRSREPWTPKDGFYDRLTHQALKEKQRAVTRAQADWFANPFLRSLRAPRAVPAASWGWAIGMAVIVLAAVGVYWGVRDYSTRLGKMNFVMGAVHTAHGSAPWSLATDGRSVRHGSNVRTATDGEAIVTLSDHSSVYLGTFSEVSFSRERHVELKSGMAWFEVKPGETEFTIEIPSYGSVRVLGTSFGIYVDSNADECSVAVAGGRVVVDGQEGRAVLSDGEEAAISSGRGPVKRSPQHLRELLDLREKLVEKRNEYDLKKYYPSLAAPLR